MCKGASQEECKQFRIPDNLEGFAYLSASGCSTIAGVDDGADFVHVKHSLGVVGIHPESQVPSAHCLGARQPLTCHPGPSATVRDAH